MWLIRDFIFIVLAIIVIYLLVKLVIWGWPFFKVVVLILIGLIGLAGPVIYIWAVVSHFRDGEILSGIWILLFGWIPALLVAGLALFGLTQLIPIFFESALILAF